MRAFMCEARCTFSSEVRTGTVVAANVTTTVNAALSQPGSISGRVTQSDGVTPISRLCGSKSELCTRFGVRAA